MKYISILFALFCSGIAYSSEVITCGDATSVGREAKLVLHSHAQKRAQQAIELFVEKKVKTPYVNFYGQVSDLKTMSSLIEVYWCETQETPLHSAYYRFYSNNKSVFQ
ncbi:MULTISPECIES: hypothetical protein [Shewanella]|uniref:Uncharacterized protein n=1 Tax=Shewanella psychromarinicola TaxID=2487742 RepID=A0A3N4ECS0_9GAMM|nr:hypothetical protein [Shewanella psychromarinicola]AZG36762.1 hypothetical protein EGC80_19125 [Shewanella psychromarinicola]MCL1081966.1 hypothetical protein [Shewanella psychromarinicola]RPA34616.1 hypothetical protein EGC77_02785 [Shewanella psychromarinicola]